MPATLPWQYHGVPECLEQPQWEQQRLVRQLRWREGRWVSDVRECKWDLFLTPLTGPPPRTPLILSKLIYACPSLDYNPIKTMNNESCTRSRNKIKNKFNAISTMLIYLTLFGTPTYYQVYSWAITLYYDSTNVKSCRCKDTRFMWSNWLSRKPSHVTLKLVPSLHTGPCTKTCSDKSWEIMRLFYPNVA